jgi:type IV secretion system protein VirB9
MNQMFLTVGILLSICLTAAPAVGKQTSPSGRGAAPPKVEGSRGAERASAETPLPARVIPYGERDVAHIRTKVRYSTLIVLPTSEVILDFVVGDKDLWVIEGNQNLAYVKPAKEGSQTNLNLITAGGNVYSFVLTEISSAAAVQPDLKVYIVAKDASMQEAASAPRRFVAAQELEDLRQQAQQAKEETRQVQESSLAAIEEGINRFVTNVRFAYSFAAGKKPFYVRAMYHDDSFTYIQARPEETPTLYEIKDGKPNLVNFDYRNGVYVVHKILDRGYLVVGKHKLAFKREE